MAEKLTPPKDHNQPPPSKAMFLAHLRKVAPLKIAIEEANGTYRAALKSAKADGINQKALVRALAARRQDPDQLAKDELDFQRMMAWMGMPIGAQSNLFGTEEPDDTLTPAERAEQNLFEAGQAGYEAGRAGRPRSDNPHQAGIEPHVRWDEQWLRGQARIANEMKPKEEKVGEPRRGKGVPKPKTDAVH